MVVIILNFYLNIFHIFFQSILVICLLGCLEMCASNLMEHEIQPEIQGSQHPEPSAKGKRDPRIFFGVNALLSF